MFDPHVSELLREMYADHREFERKGEEPPPFNAMMHKIFGMVSMKYAETFQKRVDFLVREGLIAHDGSFYRLTTQGREIAKRMFDEMLKRDGWTEEQFFDDEKEHEDHTTEH